MGARRLDAPIRETPRERPAASRFLAALTSAPRSSHATAPPPGFVPPREATRQRGG